MSDIKPWDQKIRASVPIFDLCDGELGCRCPEKKAETAPHGTTRRYRKCHCAKCSEANTNYHRQWRKKKLENA